MAGGFQKTLEPTSPSCGRTRSSTARSSSKPQTRVPRRCSPRWPFRAGDSRRPTRATRPAVVPSLRASPKASVTETPAHHRPYRSGGRLCHGPPLPGPVPESPPHTGRAARCSPQAAKSGLALLALTGLARQSGFRERSDAEELSSWQPPPHRLHPPLSWRFVDSERGGRSSGLDPPAPVGPPGTARPLAAPSSGAPFQRSASGKRVVVKADPTYLLGFLIHREGTTDAR